MPPHAKIITVALSILQPDWLYIEAFCLSIIGMTLLGWDCVRDETVEKDVTELTSWENFNRMNKNTAVREPMAEEHFIETGKGTF